ncbi:hypothetical protein ACLOJK_011872 [Asimina triloba]
MVGGSKGESRKPFDFLIFMDFVSEFVVLLSSGVSEAEDGGNDTVTRDRSNGKDRSSRRRRVSSSNESFRVDRDDIVDGSSEESLDEEQDEEDEVIRRSGGSSRQSSRGKSQWKVNFRFSGLLRASSAKRLQDSFSAARQSSSSSPARTSAASLSPPSSNASMKAGKRMVSISESEVEVAQFLFGLTKLQSHPPPPKSEIFQTSPKLDPKHNSPNDDSVSVVSKASSPVSTPVSTISQALPQHSSPIPIPTVTAPKRKKPRPAQLEENGNSPTLMLCPSKLSGSTHAGQPTGLAAAAPVIKIERDKELHKLETSSPESSKNAVVSNSGSSKPDTSLPVSPSSQTSGYKDPQHSDVKPSSSPLEAKTVVSPDMKLPGSVLPKEGRLSDADLKTPINQNDGITQKETSSSNKDFPVPDVKLDAPKIGGSAAVAEGLRGSRIEIDLMAPPENSCPDDCMPEVIDRCAGLSSHNEHDTDGTVIKSKDVTAKAEGLETEETRAKKSGGFLEQQVKVQVKEAAGAAISEKQLVDERRTELNPDGNNLDKASSRLQNPQKVQKSGARQADRPAPTMGIMSSASTPTPMMIPGWPGGLPPFGYNPAGVPSVRGAIPMDANAAIPNAPVVMLSQPRPNRCATHLFIARLIHYQQQLARLNPFWHAAAAAGSAALYGAKPYNMNMLPQSDVLLCGGSANRNPNNVTNNGLATGSVITINGQNPKEKASNSLTDAHKKQPLLPQSVQQGPACIFPVSQSRAGETKPSSLPESAGLLSASGAAAAAAAASANAKFNSIAATSDPQYLAMLQNNYPFPVPPPYRAHINQQQLQPLAAPFFAGSFYPSQLLHLQSHPLPQMQNPNNSPSVTSQKPHVRPQHGFPTSKTPESHSIEPETTKNSEDGHDSQSSFAQKKLQVQSFPGNPSFNYPNFPIMVMGQGGKQPQQSGDPTLQMGMKGVDLAGPIPPGHGVLQPLSDIGHNHYHLGNLSKAPAKAPVARSNDKSTESSHSPSIAAAGQQQQVVSRVKPTVSSASAAMVSGTVAYADRLSVAYTSPNFPSGAMGFPNVQNPLQWKMQSSQRVAQAGPPGNTLAQSPAAALAISNAGTAGGKGAKLPSPTLNSSQKLMSAGSSVSSQSTQAQTLGKTQQLFFSNSEPVHQSGGAGSALAQKRHPEPNPMAQAVFPGSLNMRRPPNPQGQPVLTAAGAGSYLVGGGKGATVYSPLVGGPIAAMAGASFGKSAANLPAKSTEQKPTTARVVKVCRAEAKFQQCSPPQWAVRRSRPWSDRVDGASFDQIRHRAHILTREIR